MAEYDPSQPLDSSDEEDSSPSTLNFEKPGAVTVATVEGPGPGRPSPVPKTLPPLKDVDLSTIPMPTDEYRRPAIQFSIPTRHRLMSISSLIKRQKGVVKKDNGKGASCFNSEVSKAFLKDGGEDGQDSGDERPKNLVQEIFGSDEEEGAKEEESNLEKNAEGINQVPEDEDESTEIPVIPLPLDTHLEENKWKTISEVPVVNAAPLTVHNDDLSTEKGSEGSNGDKSPDGGPLISIKPCSELMETPGNESSSPDVIAIDNDDFVQVNNSEKRPENKQVILECVSDDDDFEVTFVGIGKANLADIRQGRLRKQQDTGRQKKSSSASPHNGFEEGELVESDKRRKKDKNKKKDETKDKRKRRKRSKDSRVSSKRTSESSDRRSFSDSDNDVSWRKPKQTKARNYRNGKKDSEERDPHLLGDRDRSHKRDEVGRRRSRSRTPPRYPSTSRSRFRRNHSASSPKYRSRSRSISRSRSPPPWKHRHKGPKRGRRAGSFGSRGSFSRSPSLSRSRSPVKKKMKKHHSPSPIRRHRHKSVSPSPSRLSKSPSQRVRKKSKAGTSDTKKHEKSAPKAPSPVNVPSNKKTSKSSASADEGKKKGKKEKVALIEETEKKEKKKKKKREKREKSLSPVKAIMADGDSIVVSLSFQKAKEETKSSKSSSTRADRSSESHKRSDSNISGNCEEIEAPIANVKPMTRKGTITINLNASPVRDKEEKKKSPDVTKPEEKKVSDDVKSTEEREEKDSESLDDLDFVSSSHDNSVDNTQAAFSKSPEKPNSPPPPEPPLSRSPHKLGDFLVSSSSDSKAVASPSVTKESPKTSKTGGDGTTTEGTASNPAQKAVPNSPFDNLRATASNPDNAQEKAKTPSPEGSKIPPVPRPAMIGNIPGLFPSGFGSASSVAPPPVIIPTPPKITPSSTSSSNLINDLVSVASALYAPLLAAKQPGPGGMTRTPLMGNKLFPPKHTRANNNGTGRGQGEGDSPFSPNSSDGDDLFEPPSADANHLGDGSKGAIGGDRSGAGASSNSGGMNKRTLFDTLFAPGPQKSKSSPMKPKKPSSSRDAKKGKHKKHTPSPTKRPPPPEMDKNGLDFDARFGEDVPNSAVSLRIKEKFLKKLNRQERVVEEVKLSLKPYYIKKHVTKDEYKDILRRAVPKICHNKTGEINPHKIKELIEAYVKKIRKSRKQENKVL